jgi:hypothetical protein
MKAEKAIFFIQKQRIVAEIGSVCFGGFLYLIGSD